MKDKKEYKDIELSIIEVSNRDVIVCSCDPGDDNCTPFEEEEENQ